MGRPTTAAAIAKLVVRMARDNPGWEYTRIRGALFNLGHDVGRNTIKRTLADAGLEPAPERSRSTSWKTFLKAQDRRSVPWDAIPWRPRIHLGLFVHRVNGLSPGLYVLARDPEKLEALRQAMRHEFLWRRPPSCPRGLPLYLLKEGDYRAQAASISCGQDIAGDGAFSLGMIADYMGSLVSYGAAFYRNLFWEAGLVGQVLYLEAEEAGIRSTGIGCYFDDLLHDVFGISSRDWQSLYHFTVGGPVEDKRLSTLPAYKMEKER
jgi:hypothetical protein